MNTGILLGNERLHRQLRTATDQGKLSHCYLVSGSAGSGRGPLLKLLCLALLCTAPGNRPCLHCPQCRKVLSGAHPDVIVVDDPEKKIVPVELVRRARADAFIRPNEGTKKIYIFPRAEALNLAGQNTLLKILEEPPAYGVFLLVAENPDRLLVTVRSRCVELALSPLPNETILQALAQRFPDIPAETRRAAAASCSGILGTAISALRAPAKHTPHTEAFGKAFAANDRLALLSLTASMAKLQRDDLAEECAAWIALLSEALGWRLGRRAAPPLAQTIGHGRTAEEIDTAIATLRRALEYTTYNVGTGHILGMLAARL